MPEAPSRELHANHGYREIAGNGDSRAAREVCGTEATGVIRRLAERQHGVVARRQLLRLGLSADLLDGRLEAGYLIPVHEGVFAVGRARVGRLGRWMAAVLATGPNSVLSHGSATALWGIRGSRGVAEVTRRSGGTTRHEVRLHQTRVLDPEEVTAEEGIPVTSIERTLLDIAARLDLRQIEQAVVAADRTGRLRWREMERLLERTPRRPGAGRLRKVVRSVSPRAVDARSTLEIDFLALCRKAGLPVPQVNVLIDGFLIDFLWPAERLIVETDTYRYHGDRLAFERDRDRSIRLAANGYEVHRITESMLRRDPNLYLGLVRQALARRRESRLPGNSRQP